MSTPLWNSVDRIATPAEAIREKPADRSEAGRRSKDLEALAPRLFEAVEGRVQIFHPLSQCRAFFAENIGARPETRTRPARRVLRRDVFDANRQRQFAGDRLDRCELLAHLRDHRLVPGLVLSELRVFEFDRGGTLGQGAGVKEKVRGPRRGTANTQGERGNCNNEIPRNVELLEAGLRMGKDEDRVKLPRHSSTSLPRCIPRPES